jgi:hypothetical protein
MKRLSVFLTIILAVCVLSNCSPPAGSIDNSGNNGGNGNGNGNGNSNGGNSGYDTLWVIPTRLFYEKGEKFLREYDLQIFSADNGIVRQVNPAESGVIITISETSTFGDPRNPVIVGAAPHPLTFPGIYRVEVKYNSKDARYSFEVRGYYNPEGDGSGFLDIIWL